MKYVLMISAFIAIGLIIAASKTGSDLSELREKISNLESEIDDVNALRENISSLETDNDILTKRINEHEEIPDIDRIVEVLATSKKEELIDSIAQTLTTDDAYIEALRGSEGEPSDPEEIVALLLIAGFSEYVSSELWSNHGEEIVSNPELVASSADEVYRKYGSDLLGRASRSEEIDPEVIANILSEEPVFAALVASSMRNTSEK